METDASNAMNDNFARLATFQQYPLPSQGGRKHASLLRYNSPLKLSKAGFHRFPDAPGDEVKCYRCSVRYRGWTGESPMAVHRILSPDCPHVVNQTPARLTVRTPRVGANRVRRCLQMGSPAPNQTSEDVTDNTARQHSVLDLYDSYQTPRTPDQSDSDDSEEIGSMLFESHRLLTFPSPTHPLSEEWAASGFVHQGEGDVVRCVFCGVELQYEIDQPAKIHQQQAQYCPLVKYLDVGNIPRDLEDSVRSNHLEHSDDNGDTCASDNPLFKHPQFEELQSRLETYKYWPSETIPTADALSHAGFFYSGYADKVACFACGCSFRNWNREADPWTQHARHAPHCVFVKQERGDSFILEAQEAPVLTDCDTPTDSSSDASSCHTSSPLRPSLDLSAVSAALACQYDVQQIRHAILKFFLSTRGSYPNEALLLGTLRASDVNFSQLQRQREQLHTKNLSIIRQAEELQQKDQALERKDEELGRKDEVIEENQTELETERQTREREVRELKVMLAQEKSLVQSQAQVIQRHTHDLRSQAHSLRTTQQALHEKTDQLINWGEEMERKQREMDRQAEEIRRQADKMRKLMELLQANNIAVDNEDDNNVGNADNNANRPVVQTDPSTPYTRCKICLEEDARCAFRPCRHMCCGTHCAPRFIGDRCPICRDRVQDWEVIYVA